MRTPPDPSSAYDRCAIARALHRLARWYPGGVAKRLLVAAGEATAARQAEEELIAPSSEFGLWFIASERESQLAEFLASDAGQLLRAAVEKGLKQPFAPTSVRAAEQLEQLTGVCLLLGEALSCGPSAGLGVGEWRDEPRVAYGVTHPLSAVLAQPSLKRQFWLHLQEAAARASQRASARTS